MIVFFGDHQPADSVVRPVWKLNGKDDADLTDEEEALRYKVPFFIWQTSISKRKKIWKSAQTILRQRRWTPPGFQNPLTITSCRSCARKYPSFQPTM